MLLCRHQEDLQQLVELLQELQAGHQDAPLLSVDLAAASRQGPVAGGSGSKEDEDAAEGAATASEASGFVAADGSKDAEDWELV
jgi:hypothetical protein